MRRHTISAIVMSIPLGTFTSAAHAACNPAQIGTAACPEFTAPATTAVPGPSMGGTVLVHGPGMSVTLFDGAVPPNGFMVQMNFPNFPGNFCWVNDNGPPGVNPSKGFLIGGQFESGPGVSFPLPNTFHTPP